MSQDDPLWTLVYDEYDQENEKHREALCTTGNGYMGCRGACEESHSGPLHYPGTYVAGLYNRLTSRVGDHDVVNEDFVNIPDWTWITFRFEQGDWFDIDQAEILSFNRTLDLRRGVLHRTLRVQHPDGRISRIASSRLVSMARRHLAAIRYSVTPENYEGLLTLRSGLNGAIRNAGVDRYNDLNQEHLQRVTEGQDVRAIVLGVITTESAISIEERAVHLLYNGNDELLYPTRVESSERKVWADFDLTVSRGTPVVMEKRVAIETSRDQDVTDPRTAAIRTMLESGNWEQIREEHEQAWQRIWDRIDIRIEGDDETTRINRLHAYHLLCTASPFQPEIDAGIPARGLHGEAYRGHIFWDEIFVLPLYCLHFPEIAKSLLLYRYRRLDKAREYARELRYRGAMFPWQSGSDGREETQVLHLNPISGKWGDDYSCLQRHVSLAIAWNTWQYVHTTGDIDFLQQFGAEMLLSIATFWADRCERNPETGRYSISGVMGPNEFHEKQPGHDKGGLKDNAYTNIMSVWLLERALQTIEILPASKAFRLMHQLEITDDDLQRWRDITRNMFVGVQNGIIDQYDGFLQLKELEWDHYRQKYGDIGRMDRILKAEGKSPDAYQLSKQGDLLMLFFVLPFHEIQRILHQLGIPFSREDLLRNYTYYEARTSHGSTLSLGVHAYTAALLGDLETSLHWYREALHADLGDIQGGTTKEGIHIALMASTLSLILFAYAGVDVSGEHLSLQPSLPADWREVAFCLTFRGTHFHFKVRQDAITVETEGEEPATIRVASENIEIRPGQSTTIPIPAAAAKQESHP